VDRLVASFNTYDFFGYILCGGLLLAGSYWAFEGEFLALSTAGAFGVIGLAYITGHAVQSLANFTTERVLWWSKNPRHKAALDRLTDDNTRSDVARALAKATQRDRGDFEELSNARIFEMARSVLRHKGLDARAEVMDAMYGFCRGSATSCALLVVITVVAGLVVDQAWTRLGIAACLFATAALLLGLRTRRFGNHLADQVICDCRVLN
jgi:Flp pilus assembly protein TadB